MTLTTSPVTRVPTGYFFSTFSHGLADFCLRPSAIFSRSLSTCRTITSTWSSILSMSLGWLIRPQLMSVMCSRPSMPPRSTKAPKSAMFLTVPLRTWPTADLLEQLLLLGLAGDLDQLAAADDDVAPALVDLQDHALDVLIDVIGDVGWTADVDLAGGQEDVDADIDQQPALDLAGDASLDDVAFVIAGDDHLPGAHPVRFLARQDDLAGLVFHALEQDFDVVARLGGRLVLPLVERNQALGLVADIDDHLVADDLDHLARDDAADLEALAPAQELVEGVGAVLAGHQGRELIIADIKFTKQITIYHVRVSFPYPSPRRQSRRNEPPHQPRRAERIVAPSHQGPEPSSIALIGILASE